MIFETPIFDRTQTNVNNVKRGINDDKGAFLYTVANRIENNSKYISILLTSLGYSISIETKEWAREDIPNIEDINRMKNNLEKIKQGYTYFTTTPNADTSKISLNFVDINDMEKILFDINELIKYMSQNFIYSGVANSGQNRVWQQRFRRNRTWNTIRQNRFEQFSDETTISNISSMSDKKANGIVEVSSVYGTVLYLNNKYNEIDTMIGGNNE